VIFTTQLLSQSWTIQKSGVSFALRSVCFVDSINGWAIGDSSVIISTSNGGINWKQHPLIDSLNYPKKIQFISKSVGYIVGENGLILSTKDGGEKWIKDAHVFSVDFCDISFIDENEGWITGNKIYTDHGNGLILHTTNGGLTWDRQIDTISTNQFGAVLFSSIRFMNNKIGWALSSDYVDNF